MSEILVDLFLQEKLKTAKDKLKFAEIAQDVVDGEFIEPQELLYRGFKRLFNIVLSHELDYGELLALGNEQLQKVYDEFGQAMEEDSVD